MKKYIRFTAAFLMLLVIIAVPVRVLYADIINVPGDQPTIQTGLNAAAFGDTVLVAPGTYFENIIWPDVNGIKLSGSGMYSTIINGNNAASVIRFDTANIIDTFTVVRGFTVTNGFAQPPWPESQGGGFCLFYASPILEYLNISGNTADDFGGGIYIWGSTSDPIIRYVVIANNTAISHGGVDCAAGAPVFDHVTVAGNNPGGLFFDTNGYPLVINSIVAYNFDFSIRVEGNSFENTTIAVGYSDIPYPIQLIGYAYVDLLGGVIDGNPLFVDIFNDDFHLQPGSPCIDAGDPTYPYDPDGTITDMGVFYFHQTTAIDESPELPDKALLYQNYPNPFNAQTAIRYVIPSESYVTIEIFDILGKKVETLVNRDETPGTHSVTWDASDFPSGIYFYRLNAGKYSATYNMTLLK